MSIKRSTRVMYLKRKKRRLKHIITDSKKPDKKSEFLKSRQISCRAALALEPAVEF